jgi:hypothetical protein
MSFTKKGDALGCSGIDNKTAVCGQRMAKKRNLGPPTQDIQETQARTPVLTTLVIGSLDML